MQFAWNVDVNGNYAITLMEVSCFTQMYCVWLHDSSLFFIYFVTLYWSSSNAFSLCCEGDSVRLITCWLLLFDSLSKEFFYDIIENLISFVAFSLNISLGGLLQLQIKHTEMRHTQHKTVSLFYQKIIDCYWKNKTETVNSTLGVWHKTYCV